ncbi:MAG: hypothetical protein AB7V42_15380 [Thermoleophilia bacterium]
MTLLADRALPDIEILPVDGDEAPRVAALPPPFWAVAREPDIVPLEAGGDAAPRVVRAPPARRPDPPARRPAPSGRRPIAAPPARAGGPRTTPLAPWRRQGALPAPPRSAEAPPAPRPAPVPAPPAVRPAPTVRPASARPATPPARLPAPPARPAPPAAAAATGPAPLDVPAWVRTRAAPPAAAPPAADPPPAPPRAPDRPAAARGRRPDPATRGRRIRRRAVPLVALLACSAALLTAVGAGVGDMRDGSATPVGAVADAAPAARPAPTPAALREIPPAYLALYVRFAAEEDIDWRLLAAIGGQESDHGRNPWADRVNHAGCVGPMQLGVGGRCGDFVGAWGVDGDGDGRIDPLDPADAIATAARGLREAKGAPPPGGSRAANRQAACGYYGACSDAHARYADDVMRRAERYGFPRGA